MNANPLLTERLNAAAASGVEAEHQGALLPSCDYRTATACPGVYFCRHPRVYCDRSLVVAEMCRLCRQRHDAPSEMRDVPADPLAIPAPPPLTYVSLEALASDVRMLAGKVPPDVTAVAGIPRSGMIPAAQLATLLHLPLYEMNRETGLKLLGCGLRLEQNEPAAGRLLVVDDSVYNGFAMGRARLALQRTAPQRRAIFAAVYPCPESLRHVNLFSRPLPAPHLFEWNLFNCGKSDQLAFDLDGVLCGDWLCGDEDEVALEYQQFLEHAPPRWLPRRTTVRLIVTARLEKHRGSTLAWLARHGVRVQQLIMGPWTSAAERRRHYDAAKFKGTAYAESTCTLFIESDQRQAEAIWREAGKPVLCPATGKVFQ